MILIWNKIKSGALLLSPTWAEACNEASQAKAFGMGLFDILGITDQRVATFALNVQQHGGAHGFRGLLRPGVLWGEPKSRGISLDDAVDQAIG
jgi:hypothetical protein